MNIVIFGPPGAGKGTQADYLVKNFDLFKVSTGDLLRIEINKKNKFGNTIKEVIDDGKLVSDEIINNLISNVISNKKNSNKMIFDGYPRNINQAKNLDDIIKKNNQKISCVLNINVEQDVIVKRILGRQVCSKCGQIFNKYYLPANKDNHNCESKYLETRSDDNEETIIKRFEIYKKQTMPIIEYYQNMNLLFDVNGMSEIPSIYKEISDIIKRL